MKKRFNPFIGNLDFAPKDKILSSKYEYHINALASYDRIQEIELLDEGARNQRINKVTMTSVEFPKSEILIDVFWLGVGTINQRIEKLEISGPVLTPDKIRKSFEYNQIDGKYIYKGFNLELF